MSKVFVLGIDGAPPEYIFNEWLDELPTIKRLIEEGCYAKLNSSIPPLSAVAWASMTTGKKPADIGIFEYIYRRNYSYEDVHVISSKNVKEKTIWQIASENNKKSIICLLLLTWPSKPFNGIMVNGELTPNTSVDYTYPKEIKQEINSLFDNFKIYNDDFRDFSKKKIIKTAHEITKMHLKLMKYLLKNKKWDLFFGVINQSDPVNHNFLKFVDKEHRKYNPKSKFKDAMKNYYKFVDKGIGELIELLDKDTKIIVLSDHGIKKMHSRVNLSDWLINEGYLVLKQPFREKVKLTIDMIDWEKTKAWAIGAYEGQIFINLKGKEKKGIVEPEDYDNLINELQEKLRKITGDEGEILDTKFFTKKKDFQGKYQDIAPDMIVYFDNLQYGCNNSLIGNKTLWSPQTARGSDDAGHSQQGIFIMNNGRCKGNLREIDVIDVAPIILNELGINAPEDMKGRAIM